MHKNTYPDGWFPDNIKFKNVSSVSTSVGTILQKIKNILQKKKKNQSIYYFPLFSSFSLLSTILDYDCNSYP